jgi:hypothetical protein
MFAKYLAGKAGTVALIALLAVLGPSYAQPGASQQGWPINHPSSSSSFPWNSPGYQGYNEPGYAVRPIYVAAPMAQPEKYEVYVNALAMEATAGVAGRDNVQCQATFGELANGTPLPATRAAFWFSGSRVLPLLS